MFWASKLAFKLLDQLKSDKARAFATCNRVAHSCQVFHKQFPLEPGCVRPSSLTICQFKRSSSKIDKKMALILKNLGLKCET